MNLFKKLNNQIEVNNIADNLKITEADEINFIFNGIDYDSIFNEYVSHTVDGEYYFYKIPTYQSPTTKKKEEKEEHTNDKKEIKKEEEKPANDMQKEYDKKIQEYIEAPIKLLQKECSKNGKFESICSGTGRVTPINYTEKSSDDEKTKALRKELREEIKGIIYDLIVINSNKEFKKVAKKILDDFPILKANRHA